MPIRRSPILDNAMLADAVRKGWITLPALTDDVPPPRNPVMPLHDLLDELRRDREER
jgi:hypothetical protein